jgi:hypothetical protein
MAMSCSLGRGCPRTTIRSTLPWRRSTRRSRSWLESPEGGLNGAPVDRLVGAAGTLEELTERFKTDNALLRDWLSYVGLLSTNPDFLERNPLLAKSIDALAAAILQVTLDSSALSGNFLRLLAPSIVFAASAFVVFNEWN